MERQWWGPLCLSKARPCGHPRASLRTLINPVFAELFPGFLPTQSAPCGIGLCLPFSHTLWCTSVSPRFRVSPQMTDEIWAPTTRAEALKVVSAILSTNKTVHKLFTACLMRGQWKTLFTVGLLRSIGAQRKHSQRVTASARTTTGSFTQSERSREVLNQLHWKLDPLANTVAKLHSCSNAKEGSKDLSWTDF